MSTQCHRGRSPQVTIATVSEPIFQRKSQVFTGIGLIQNMGLRSLVTTHLPKAAVASAVILAFNAYTEGMATPVRVGIEFLLYTIAIFVGFVAFDIVLDSISDVRES